MTDHHEVVIRLGRPFDIQGERGPFAVGVREVTITFDSREAAEAAQRDIVIFVRPVHDAGGEDYRVVVPGQVEEPRDRTLEDSGPDYQPPPDITGVVVRGKTPYGGLRGPLGSGSGW